MSVVDDFVEVIESRLCTIHGVTVVNPTRQGQNQIADKVIVLDTQDVEPLPEYDRIGNPPAVGQQLPVIVTFNTIPSELTEPEAFEKQASENGSSAQNAITNPADGSAWYTFGGKSIDAMISPVRFIQPSSDGAGSAQFTVWIKYRVNETNFETLRA